MIDWSDWEITPLLMRVILRKPYYRRYRITGGVGCIIIDWDYAMEKRP